MHAGTSRQKRQHAPVQNRELAEVSIRRSSVMERNAIHVEATASASLGAYASHLQDLMQYPHNYMQDQGSSPPGVRLFLNSFAFSNVAPARQSLYDQPAWCDTRSHRHPLMRVLLRKDNPPDGLDLENSGVIFTTFRLPTRSTCPTRRIESRVGSVFTIAGTEALFSETNSSKTGDYSPGERQHCSGIAGVTEMIHGKQIRNGLQDPGEALRPDLDRDEFFCNIRHPMST
ncbi:MAG: hypothetical protein Q9213_003624 [Squamulea squamosa]